LYWERKSEQRGGEKKEKRRIQKCIRNSSRDKFNVDYLFEGVL
jgi:hypothetical protein